MDGNHYALDWRYMSIDNFLQLQLDSCQGISWEFSSIRQALSQLLNKRKRQTYRFSTVAVAAQSPNPRP